MGQLDFNNAPDEKIALVTHRKEYTNAAYDLGLKGYDLTLLKMNKSYSNFFSIDEIRRIQHLNMVIPEKLVSVFLTKSILGSGKLKLLRVEMKQANCSKQKEIWCDNCCEKANICLIEKRLWLNLVRFMITISDSDLLYNEGQPIVWWFCLQHRRRWKSKTLWHN